jgi:hypothetical protein
LKIDYAAGSYESIKDFGVAGQVEYSVILDADELASTEYQVDVYTRETDTDSWERMNGGSSVAIDTSSVLTFTRSRYVRTVVTVTGGEFPSGVAGY